MLFGREMPREEWLAFETEKEGLYREISRGRLTPLPGLLAWLDRLNLHTIDGFDVRHQVVGLVAYHLAPGMWHKSSSPVSDGAFRRLSQKVDLELLARFARASTRLMPRLGGVKVVRQWAGCYDVTPDNNPILGPAGFANFHQLHGFVGHGFMMAPIIAKLYAEYLTGGTKHEIFERSPLSRFHGGAPSTMAHGISVSPLHLATGAAAIINGGIDLSVGSMFALCGVLLVMAITEWHWPWPVAATIAWP